MQRTPEELFAIDVSQATDAELLTLLGEAEELCRRTRVAALAHRRELRSRRLVAVSRVEFAQSCADVASPVRASW
ncbi:MAG TPA: hypothetical protein VHZ97_31680 [Pseudonocardiaceae bacterium]|nr:hypothetical protein [Pseudonocardiaceae bacterium]